MNEEIKVIGENQKKIKNKFLKNSLELEKINKKAEKESNKREQEKILKKAFLIEETLDNLEKKLGDFNFDGGEILKIYESLDEQTVAQEVENDGVEEIVKGLIKGRDVAGQIKKREFFGEKLSKVIACFLFLLLGGPEKIEAKVEMNEDCLKSKIEKKSSKETTIKEELDKIRSKKIDEFIGRIKIVKVFHKQDFFDIKIPSKPKGFEEDDWEIQFQEKGTTIGRFEVGEESFVGAFGRGLGVEIEEIFLVIRKKNGDIEKIALNFSDEGITKKNQYREDLQEKTKEKIDEIKKINNRKERFDLILKELKANDNFEEVRKRMEGYFVQQVSQEIQDIFKKDFSSDQLASEKDVFENEILNIFLSQNISEETQKSIMELLEGIDRSLYEKEMENLSGQEKLKKISQDPFRYGAVFLDDLEVSNLIKEKVNKINALANIKDKKDEFEEVFRELSEIFEAYQPVKNSPFSQYYQGYKKIKENLFG